MDFPPLETQYRFATFNYIEFSELFYEKALGVLQGDCYAAGA
jgi:hypothetical protein